MNNTKVKYVDVFLYENNTCKNYSSIEALAEEYFSSKLGKAIDIILFYYIDYINKEGDTSLVLSLSKSMRNYDNTKKKKIHYYDKFQASEHLSLFLDRNKTTFKNKTRLFNIIVDDFFTKDEKEINNIVRIYHRRTKPIGIGNDGHTLPSLVQNDSSKELFSQVNIHITRKGSLNSELITLNAGDRLTIECQ